jgi:hypothetical protein
MIAFKKVKRDDLMGGVEVVHTAESDVREPGSREITLKIRASKRGLAVEGFLPLESMDDLQVLAKGVSDAWKDHLSLKPVLSRTTSGH